MLWQEDRKSLCSEDLDSRERTDLVPKEKLHGCEITEPSACVNLQSHIFLTEKGTMLFGDGLSSITKPWLNRHKILRITQGCSIPISLDSKIYPLQENMSSGYQTWKYSLWSLEWVN